MGFFCWFLFNVNKSFINQLKYLKALLYHKNLYRNIPLNTLVNICQRLAETWNLSRREVNILLKKKYENKVTYMKKNDKWEWPLDDDIEQRSPRQKTKNKDNMIEKNDNINKTNSKHNDSIIPTNDNKVISLNDNNVILGDDDSIINDDDDDKQEEWQEGQNIEVVDKNENIIIKCATIGKKMSERFWIFYSKNNVGKNFKNKKIGDLKQYFAFSPSDNKKKLQDLDGIYVYAQYVRFYQVKKKKNNKDLNNNNNNNNYKKVTSSKRVLSMHKDTNIPKPKITYKYDIKDVDNFICIKDTKLKFYDHEKDIGTFVVKKKNIIDEYLGKSIVDMNMDLSVDLDSDDDVDVQTATDIIHDRPC